ncbi:MAG: NifB/NifX family molybdenum-iron cluster-binding protein [Anaerolineaceae bacterium]|nr:NifB/NifX family molybdenum-iron cluster-binding protein [Anaerolineaceae bacterium]
MKIAISSHDGKFNTQFSSRFGRCNYFVIVDSETRSWDVLSNPAASAGGGAGSQVVQFLSDNRVEVIISGRFGPNAFFALQAAGVQAYKASRGTPEELLEKFIAGNLELAAGVSNRGRHQRG